MMYLLKYTVYQCIMIAGIPVYTVQSEPSDVFVVPVQLLIHSTVTQPTWVHSLVNQKWHQVELSHEEELIRSK